MMKCFSQALPLLLLSLSLLPASVNSQCLTTGFILDEIEECSFDSILPSFTRVFEEAKNRGLTCGHDAEQELRLLLNNSPSSGAADIYLKANVCQPGFDNYEGKVPYEMIAGYGTKFDNDYFTKGGTDWNEQRATIYNRYDEIDRADGEDRYLLEDDASHVDSFYDSQGRYGMVEFPVSHVESIQNCQYNSFYCCWPQDRQANDNNGNCDDPYDDNCLDSDPADNTDLCYSNTNDGKLVFPGEDNNNQRNAEGPIHCHGTAWANPETADVSWAFRGNNLFYISMYDHLYQRGYVRGIEGSPMCGCAEDMPVASRSDCTEMAVDLVLEFHYDGTNWRMDLEKVAIAFNACEGYNRLGEEQNNDLFSYANRLYMEDKINEGALLAISKQLVGDEPRDGICRDAEERMMHQENYMVGHRHDSTNWIPLIGKGMLTIQSPYPVMGRSSARTALLAESNLPILERVCVHCVITHQHIFYRRRSPIPDNIDLVDLLANSNSVVAGNVWNVDFSMHSTYEDAVNDVNPWLCPGGVYNYGASFPGECSPSGDKVHFQSFRITQWSYRTHGAWYVRGTSPFTVMTNGQSVGAYRGPSAGSAFSKSDGTIYLTSTGYDTWDKEDELMFLPMDVAKPDFEMTVYVDEFVFTDNWSKAGLMIRESMDADSKNAALVVSGTQGVRLQIRVETGDDTDGWGWGFQGVDEAAPLWLRLRKKANEFTGFLSVDGQTWQEFDQSRYINMDTTNMVAGLFISSHHWRGDLAEAVFTQFTSTVIESDGSYTPVSSGNYADIGNAVEAVGLAEQDTSVEGRYRLSASGSDIWGDEDHFGFIHFPAPSGDFVVEARVTSIHPDLDIWTKAGIMIRDGLSSNAAHVSCLMTLDRGAFGQVRYSQGDTTDSLTLESPNPVTFAYVRLTKMGNSVTFERSGDGEKWVVFEMLEIDWLSGSNLRIGMVLTSHQWRVRATAVFDGYSVTPLASGKFIPRGGSQTTLLSTGMNIGGYDGGLPGNAVLDSDNKIHMITSGNDIGGTEDSMQMVTGEIPGADFSVTAYISEVIARGIYYKAGVMIRESDDSTSKNVFLYVTHDRVLLQYRNVDGDVSHGRGWGFEGIDETVPLWLRLVKKNNEYSGYLSADGQTWQQFDQPIYMNMESGNMRAGLGVSSNQWHNEFIEVVATDFAVAALPPTYPGFVPATNSVDLDASTGLGYAEYNPNTSAYSISGIGNDLWNGADGGHFAYFEASGNFRIQATIASIDPNPDTWTKAGIMIRQSLDANSMNALSGMTLARGAYGQFRNVNGGGTVSVGYRWNYGPVTTAAVRLTKTGNTITFSRADDGVNFEDYHTDTWLGTNNVYVGMAVSSPRWKSRATALFENWQFTQL